MSDLEFLILTMLLEAARQSPENLEKHMKKIYTQSFHDAYYGRIIKSGWRFVGETNGD
jgi:hypothetical protein